MIAIAHTQQQKPTGTHLTVKAEEMPHIVSKGLMMLLSAYKAAGTGSDPRCLDVSAQSVSNMFRESGIAKNAILDGFRAIKDGIPAVGHPKHDAFTSTTHLCGWLMGFSGIIEDPHWWAIAAGLKVEYNPWPECSLDVINTGKSPAIATEPAVEQLSTEPPKSTDPFDKINASPGSFLANMGSVENQHFLVIEDLVDGGPAIFSILAGCLKTSFAKLQHQRRIERPGVTIVDLTGKPYPGLEKFGKIFYSGVCDRPAAKGLTEDEMWHLPVMEGIWQAHKELKDRLQTRKTEDNNVEFPPHFLILRRWDAILSGWADLDNSTKKSLNEAWRFVYDHPDDQSIDVTKAVKSILTLGDDVSVIIVMSITCLGSVEDVGVNKNKLNSFLIVIPGVYGTTNGGKAVQSALSDSRLQFVTPENRPELRLAVEQGQKFSRETGCQYALVNLTGHVENAMIMTIPTFAKVAGVKTPIERVRYDFVLDKIEAPLLNG